MATSALFSRAASSARPGRKPAKLTGSPSHLRYLLRRLRQRMPEALIVVGYWPAEEEILRDARIRAAIGADYYTSSLQDTVEVCVAAACKSLGEAAISA